MPNKRALPWIMAGIIAFMIGGVILVNLFDIVTRKPEVTESKAPPTPAERLAEEDQNRHGVYEYEYLLDQLALQTGESRDSLATKIIDLKRIPRNTSDCLKILTTLEKAGHIN